MESKRRMWRWVMRSRLTVFCKGRLMWKVRKRHLDVHAGHFNEMMKRNVLVKFSLRVQERLPELKRRS